MDELVVVEEVVDLENACCAIREVRLVGSLFVVVASEGWVMVDSSSVVVVVVAVPGDGMCVVVCRTAARCEARTDVSVRRREKYKPWPT